MLAELGGVSVIAVLERLPVVTQRIIRSAVSSVKAQTNLYLWMGTSEVLKWYEANKTLGTQFIQYDIEAYYPSISEPLLDRAMSFACEYHEISEEHD